MYVDLFNNINISLDFSITDEESRIWTIGGKVADLISNWTVEIIN